MGQQRKKSNQKKLHNCFESPDCNCGRCQRARWIMEQRIWPYLLPDDKVILFLLIQASGEWSGRGGMSTSTLAKLLTPSEDYEKGWIAPLTSIKECIHALELAQLIKVTHHKGYANEYHVAPDFDKQDAIEERIQQNLKLNRAIVELKMRKYQRNKMVREWLAENHHLSPKQKRWLRDGKHDVYDADYYTRG